MRRPARRAEPAAAELRVRADWLIPNGEALAPDAGRRALGDALPASSGT